MFIKTTTHKRIVAEKDAEIAGLMKRLADSARRHAITEQEACGQATWIDHHEKIITDLRQRLWDLQIVANRDRARLAPFTKIRNRDSRGRFIKDTVA